MDQNPFTIIAGRPTGQHSFNIAFDIPHTDDLGLSHRIRIPA